MNHFKSNDDTKFNFLFWPVGGTDLVLFMCLNHLRVRPHKFEALFFKNLSLQFLIAVVGLPSACTLERVACPPIDVSRNLSAHVSESHLHTSPSTP